MKCPGQDTQYWGDDAIYEVNCPECNANVEFYKDDTSRKCGKCGHRFVNPKLDFGCASYCQFAEQCLGTLPEEFLGNREDLLKDKVAVMLKRHLGSDFKTISRATKLAQIGETICKQEGGNLAVVLCASYLYRVDNETMTSILKEAGADQALTQTIHRTIQGNDTEAQLQLETAIVSDAIKLATFFEQQKQGNNPTLGEKELSTAAAKNILQNEM